MLILTVLSVVVGIPTLQPSSGEIASPGVITVLVDSNIRLAGLRIVSSTQQTTTTTLSEGVGWTFELGIGIWTVFAYDFNPVTLEKGTETSPSIFTVRDRCTVLISPQPTAMLDNNNWIFGGPIYVKALTVTFTSSDNVFAVIGNEPMVADLSSSLASITQLRLTESKYVSYMCSGPDKHSSEAALVRYDIEPSLIQKNLIIVCSAVILVLGIIFWCTFAKKTGMVRPKKSQSTNQQGQSNLNNPDDEDVVATNPVEGAMKKINLPSHYEDIDRATWAAYLLLEVIVLITLIVFVVVELHVNQEENDRNSSTKITQTDRYLFYICIMCYLCLAVKRTASRFCHESRRKTELHSQASYPGFVIVFGTENQKLLLSHRLRTAYCTISMLAVLLQIILSANFFARHETINSAFYLTQLLFAEVAFVVGVPLIESGWIPRTYYTKKRKRVTHTHGPDSVDSGSQSDEESHSSVVSYQPRTKTSATPLMLPTSNKFNSSFGYNWTEMPGFGKPAVPLGYQDNIDREQSGISFGESAGAIVSVEKDNFATPPPPTPTFGMMIKNPLRDMKPLSQLSDPATVPGAYDSVKSDIALLSITSTLEENLSVADQITTLRKLLACRTSPNQDSVGKINEEKRLLEELYGTDSQTEGGLFIPPPDLELLERNYQASLTNQNSLDNRDKIQSSVLAAIASRRRSSGKGPGQSTSNNRSLNVSTSQGLSPRSVVASPVSSHSLGGSGKFKSQHLTPRLLPSRGGKGFKGRRKSAVGPPPILPKSTPQTSSLVPVSNSEGLGSSVLQASVKSTAVSPQKSAVPKMMTPKSTEMNPTTDPLSGAKSDESEYTVSDCTQQPKDSTVPNVGSTPVETDLDLGSTVEGNSKPLEMSGRTDDTIPELLKTTPQRLSVDDYSSAVLQPSSSVDVMDVSTESIQQSQPQPQPEEQPHPEITIGPREETIPVESLAPEVVIDNPTKPPLPAAGSSESASPVSSPRAGEASGTSEGGVPKSNTIAQGIDIGSLLKRSSRFLKGKKTRPKRLVQPQQAQSAATPEGDAPTPALGSRVASRFSGFNDEDTSDSEKRGLQEAAHSIRGLSMLLMLADNAEKQQAGDTRKRLQEIMVQDNLLGASVESVMVDSMPPTPIYSESASISPGISPEVGSRGGKKGKKLGKKKPISASPQQSVSPHSLKGGRGIMIKPPMPSRTSSVSARAGSTPRASPQASITDGYATSVTTLRSPRTSFGKGRGKKGKKSGYSSHTRTPSAASSSWSPQHSPRHSQNNLYGNYV